VSKKTPLGSGLVNRLVKHLPLTQSIYVEVDQHALTSSALAAVSTVQDILRILRQFC
jgi:hypothetical protein